MRKASESRKREKMIPQISKNDNRLKVHNRIRTKVMGTAERPRLNVYRSTKHIYVQLIDDMEGKTIAAVGTNEGKKGAKKTGGNLAAAKEIGKKIAEAAKAKGVTKVVFDRGGYLYHGRIKAIADAAREAGLQF